MKSQLPTLSIGYYDKVKHKFVNMHGPVVRKPIKANPRFSSRSFKMFLKVNFKLVIKKTLSQN